MALKFYILLIFLFLSCVPGHCSDVSVGRKGLVGGWQPIKNPKDPVIQGIGQFAVTTYDNDNKKDLVYQDVIKGETQVVAGTNYRLIIAAEDHGVSNNYQAVVFDQPWTHTRNLTSFEHM